MMNPFRTLLEFAGWSARKDPHGQRKRKVGHREGIAKFSHYNKAMLRCYIRSKNPDWALKDGGKA